MEIKIGQWVRNLATNTLFRVSKDVELINRLYKKYTDSYKVANTPQELVQAGDLVEFIYFFGLHQIVCIKENTIEIYGYTKKNIFHKSRITKILAPNSEGGFDLQWEVDE